jgi:hypothetical protein
MIDEYERRKRKQVALMRSLLDYGMGIVILLIGVFFLFRSRFDMPINDNYPPGDIDTIFGVMCLIYGSWRIYRGYKKNYFS